MERRILCLVSVLFLLSCSVATPICSGLSHVEFDIYVDPENSVARIGQTIFVNITVSGVTQPGLYAYEVKLHYNNSLLEPTSTEIPTDHFLKPTLSSDGVFIIDRGTVNKTGGFVSFAATLVGPEPGKTGNGTLARVEFLILKPGNSILAIGGNMPDVPKFVDGNGNTVTNESFTTKNGIVDGLPLPPPPVPPPSPAAGKQTSTFNFMGIYGYVTFPEEAHPQDNVTHELIVAAEPEGIHLNYFRLNISADTAQGETLLYNETIEDEDLPETWMLNRTIEFLIPEDTYGRLHCIIETSTHRQFTVSDGTMASDTTTVRTLTYNELQADYEELLTTYNATLFELEQWKASYQQLSNTYHELVAQHTQITEQLNFWMSEYQKINASYSELLGKYAPLNSSFSLLQINYQQLQIEYNDLSERYGSLETAYSILNLNYTNLIVGFEELQGNLTAVENRYDELYNNYLSLNSTHNAMIQEYEDLKSKDNQLTSELTWTRVLLIIFVAATAATSVYVVYSVTKKK